MKTIFTAIFLTLLLIGCSKQNAFTKFDMNKEEELSESSLQSSKVTLNEKVYGVFSAIYLNEVNPKKYNQYEYFYIYMFLKDKMHNLDTPDNVKFTLKLNGKTPIEVQELSNQNRFSHLSSVESDWNRYYLVIFEPAKKDNLKLVLENFGAKSTVLTYEK